MTTATILALALTSTPSTPPVIEAAHRTAQLGLTAEQVIANAYRLEPARARHAAPVAPPAPPADTRLTGGCHPAAKSEHFGHFDDQLERGCIAVGTVNTRFDPGAVPWISYELPTCAIEQVRIGLATLAGYAFDVTVEVWRHDPLGGGIVETLCAEQSLGEIRFQAGGVPLDCPALEGGPDPAAVRGVTLRWHTLRDQWLAGYVHGLVTDCEATDGPSLPHAR